MKKFLALLLAAMMLLAVCSAFAEDTEPKNTDGDVYSGSGDDIADYAITGIAGEEAIPLKKAIVFFNLNGSDVYEPTITYTYTIAPYTVGADSDNHITVTDSEGNKKIVTISDGTHTAGVYAGATGGVATSASIAFPSQNATVTTSATGVEVENSTDLAVTLSAFPKPGVYRYVITENTTEADKNAVGIEEGDDYDNVRYLDVYIHDADTTDDEFTAEMYGAVIFKTIETTEGKEGTDDITTTFEKTTGFEPGTPAEEGTTDYTNDENVDKYWTYDISVTKKVTGAMGDKSHEFPFYVSVTNSINGAKFTYTPDATETFTGATKDTSNVVTLSAADFAIGADAANSSLTLKDGDTIKLVGVPSVIAENAELTITVKEYNDTPDNYTATVKAQNGTITISPTAAMAALTGTAETSDFAVKTNDAENQEITITNDLPDISVTGVVVRYAPYLMILAAGVALLLVSRRKARA